MCIFRPHRDGLGYIQISGPKITVKSGVEGASMGGKTAEESSQYGAISSFLWRKL